MIDAMRLLEGNGFEVVDAFDAEPALLALEGRPDIRAVFTEVQIPGKVNGVGVDAH